MAKKPGRGNQEATMRNVRAANKDEAWLQQQVQALSARVRSLEWYVEDLHVALSQVRTLTKLVRIHSQKINWMERHEVKALKAAKR